MHTLTTSMSSRSTMPTKSSTVDAGQATGGGGGQTFVGVADRHDLVAIRISA